MKNANLFLVTSVVVILLAVALVAVLDRSSSSQSSTDVRARASTANALKFEGFVTAVNETDGTIEVSNLQFAPESRSGAAKDLGTWTVTPPIDFNFSSVSEGTRVLIAVESSTFQVSSRALTALSLVAQ